MKKYYIGFAATFHDPALAIVDQDGEVVFAEAAERHFQNKRAIGLPADSLIWSMNVIKEYCSPDAEYTLAVNWNKKVVLRKFKLINMLMHLRLLFASPEKRKKSKILSNQLILNWGVRWTMNIQRACMISAGESIEKNLQSLYNKYEVNRKEFYHHHTHAALACYTSPFRDAACIVVDGFGEKGSIEVFKFKNQRIEVVFTHKGTESLGIFYSILTEICGFQYIKGEEWKVMGLAPYGKHNDELYELMNSLYEIEGLRLKSKGGMKKRAEVIKKIYAHKVKKGARPEEAADLAYAGQKVYANLMTQLLNNLYKEGISENLILAGGCALNSSYNGRILEETPFKRLYVPSAPGDDGTALGAALLAFHQDKPDHKEERKIASPYLGNRMYEKSLQKLIEFGGIKKMRHLPQDICKETAKLLAEGKLVGWVQGRAEYGPRALGNRSILADPRSSDMKDKINSRIKFREAFRPFAPSVLHEYGEQYFENYQESPYMERTLKIKKEMQKKIPAVVHKNGTGRLQTVKKEWNAKYHELIHEFYKLTGVPVLLNTSFNIMGKPIIHTVEDAISVFYLSGLDALIIEDYLIEK